MRVFFVMYCIFIDDSCVLDEGGNSVSLRHDALEISWRGRRLALAVRHISSSVEVHVPVAAKTMAWRGTETKLTNADLYNVLAMIDDCLPLLGREVAFIRSEVAA